MVVVKRKFWKNTFLVIKANYIALAGFGTMYRLVPFIILALMCTILFIIFPGNNDLPAISHEIFSKPTFLETSGYLVKLIFVIPDSVTKWLTIGLGVVINVFATGLLQGGILNFVLSESGHDDTSQKFTGGITKKGFRMVGYQAQIFPIVLAIHGLAAFVSIALPWVAETWSPWTIFLFEMVAFTVVCIVTTPLLFAPFYYFNDQSFMESLLASVKSIWPWYLELFAVQLVLGSFCSLLGILISFLPLELGLDKIFFVFLSIVTWSAFTFSIVATASAFRMVSGGQETESAVS